MYLYKRFPAATAEDIASDACLAAFHSFGKYDRNRPFRNWFITIVRNTACKFVVKQRQSQQTEVLVSEELPGPNVQPNGRIENQENMQRLAAAVEGFLVGLTVYDRCMVNYYRNQLTHREVAQRMGCSEDSAKGRYRRLMKKLDAILDRIQRS
ncbi:MAG: sigma-70 family RNA polymerase sigma factor [Planctomycetales bacterium]|nr:sigma-70 family RNA polymerase sigma factor [Planctomycetales bacterium]